MHRLNISYKQFYVTLNEIWLFECDPNAPSTWSEPGGKQWQRSIRGRRNWDVELGPCAVIRHLCSVAFVWETKRPQADNSRSLIDRQVPCFTYEFAVEFKLDQNYILLSWHVHTLECSYVFCSDIITRNNVKVNSNCHRIWVAMGNINDKDPRLYSVKTYSA